MARCSRSLLPLEENLVEEHDVERFSHAAVAQPRGEERVREPALGGSHRLERHSLAIPRDVVPVESLVGIEGEAHLALQVRSERAQEPPGPLRHIGRVGVFLVSRGAKRERGAERESEEPELHVHPLLGEELLFYRSSVDGWNPRTSARKTTSGLASTRNLWSVS